MEQITLKVPGDVLESLDGEAEERSKSRSEYLRHIIESRHDVEDIRAEYEERLAEQAAEQEAEMERLQSRIDDLQQRLEDLREEREDLIRADARVDVLKEILERVREERDEAVRRAERNHQKLALHESEKSRFSRLRGLLPG